MVDINKVYERVLFLANKEQRGYITPDEFNSFAEQSQLEIFESYFLKKFQTEQAPASDSDYANIPDNIEEKISFFDNIADIAKDGSIYPYPPGFYRLAHVSVPGREGFPIMADEISHRDVHYVNLSPLTRPTRYQPVFERREGGVVLHPSTFVDNVTMSYVRKPAQPIWEYVMDPNAQPVYDPEASIQFELHPSEEQDLVYKILTLAGVTIKQQDIAGFGQSKDQQIAQTEG